MGPDLPHGTGEQTGVDAALDAAITSLHEIFLPDHSLTSLLQRVAELAARVLPGAAEASITLLQTGSEGATVASSGLLAYELDETQYRSGDGPCLAATTADGPVLLADTTTETRWPAFTRHARDRGATTVLSIPMTLPRSPEEREQNRRRVLAALNLYGTETGAFDPAAVRSAERFTAGATTAVANMRALTVSRAVVDGLREAVEARLVIEQAKGMLMARRGCPADEAFEVLAQESQRSQRKLRDLAADVVAGRTTLE